MENLRAILQEIGEIDMKIGAPNLVSPLESFFQDEQETIAIAILGQFKSGKSSLVNNLLEKNILPVDVVPTTAIVTTLQYGSKPKLFLSLEDGTTMEDSIEKLPNYITEKLNPKNRKKIAQAVVELPEMGEYRNIKIIDTPGLGSFYTYNSEATQRWIPFASMALVAISAERPFSEEDYALIRNVLQYCPFVALVLTKTDLFTTSALKKINEYISEITADIAKQPIPIFEYSIFNSQSREKLLSNIVIPANRETATRRKAIARHKLIALINQSVDYAKIALQLERKKESALNVIAELLENINQNKQHYEREMNVSKSSFKGDVREKVNKIIMPFCIPIANELEILLRKELSNCNGNLYHVTRHYEGWIIAQLHSKLAEIDNKCYDAYSKIAKETIGYFQFTSLRFVQLLDEKINHELNVHLPQSIWQIDFSGIDKPSISTYRTFDSQLDSLLFFLPMRWLKTLFINHFLNQIPAEVEKNLYRHISSITEHIYKTIDNAHEQALRFINNEMDAAVNILRHVNVTSTEVERYHNRLIQLKNIVSN